MPQARQPDESQSGKPEDTPGKGREDAPGQNKPRAEQQSEGDPGPGSLKEGQEVGEEVDAEAPGPITPEHESGSWEQTKREQEAQEKAREEGGKTS
jgi:hypothetical protein